MQLCHGIRSMVRRTSSKAMPRLQALQEEGERRAPPPRRGPIVTPPHPYVTHVSGEGKNVFYETYGCQMNVSDMDVVRSIMDGVDYEETREPGEADVHLIMTCSIREKAEQRIWARLTELRCDKTRRQLRRPLTIVILGCMAERLKSSLLDNGIVDVIAGPDAYRDLPRLLAHNRETHEQTLNVMLSADETYADISPVKVTGVQAFVSIMRGCNNMCTYCVVPFTRGRERSRPLVSIVDQVTRLVNEHGVREVTLLGQNVNSYRDMSSSSPSTSVCSTRRHGFSTVYRNEPSAGLTFADLLEKVAAVDDGLRVRFTAAHPKDFPLPLLHVIGDHDNICSQVHLPAQSGNNAVLDKMGRGYTRGAYEELVDEVREVIPGVSITSDFIAGFCGEDEAAHEDTLSLIRRVKYSMAYCFVYSMRGKTRAHRRFVDDVPEEVKRRRSKQLHDAFAEGAKELNEAMIGSVQRVLVEGTSRRDSSEAHGRTDGGTRVVLTTVDGRTAAPGELLDAIVTHATSHSLRAIPTMQ